MSTAIATSFAVADDQPVPFALTLAAEQLPRTWAFINRYSGEPVTITCMVGCAVDHSRDIDTPTFPEDIWCRTHSDDVTLPVNLNGTPEEYRVLSSEIGVMPFSATMAERLPHATIEILDEHCIEALDPDGLATVIRALRARLDHIEQHHARLVEVRAEYVRGQR